MAFFRQAAQAEKDKAEKKKAAEESRRKQMEMMAAVMNGEVEMGKTNQQEDEKKVEIPKTIEKKEVKDSEKMKQSTA